MLTLLVCLMVLVSSLVDSPAILMYSVDQSVFAGSMCAFAACTSAAYVISRTSTQPVESVETRHGIHARDGEGVQLQTREDF